MADITNTKDKKQTTSALHRKESTFTHLSAGAAAGLFADTIVHPLDTIRARMQVQRGINNVVFKSTIDAFIKTIRFDGLRGLYKGYAIVALATTPAHAVYFTGYEIAKKILKIDPELEQNGLKAVTAQLTAGVFADICGSIIWVPMEVIKQNLQVQSRTSQSPIQIKYKNTFHTAQTIIREEGVRGIFKGFSAGVATFAPYVAIYFTIYEQLKVKIRNSYKLRSVNDLPFSMYLLSGSVAGAIAAAITSPLDVIKTRLQTQNKDTIGTKYKGILHASKTILMEEGVKAFIKGLGPRVLWMAGGSAITISTYEEFKKFFCFVETKIKSNIK